MTKREMFAQIIAMAKGEEIAVTVEEIIEFAEKQIESLNKRSGSAKPTKTQIENEGHKASIRAILAESDRPMTISEMMEDERLAGLKNQKISAIVTLMKNNGEIVRTVEKKKAYFSLASADEATEE